MGQNQSQPLQQSSVDVVRRPPRRPGAPPSSRPISDLGPQGPSYSSPENMVLPRELPSTIKLRPVSMELSKYHPEFQEIFHHEDLDNNNGEEKKGDTPEKDFPESPPRPPPPIMNGHIPSPSEKPATQIPNGHGDNQSNKASPNNKLPYRPSHRRQLSLTTNLIGQEHTIHEEPEENIDDRVKLDPLMQSFPGATGPSLPVKNNFNLDYSYQLTYAQLQEHRRNKTLEELEKKTGKKLSDLSSDLNEHTEQSFVRFDKTRQSSKSLGSAVSTKKKMAPPPPGQAPPAPPSTLPRSMPNSPRSPSPKRGQPYSVDNEPPIDYDMESPRRNIMLPRYMASHNGVLGSPKRSSQRNSNVASIPSPPPPPPPPVPPQPSAQSVGSFAKKRPEVNLSRNNSLSLSKPELILKKTPSIKPVEKPTESDGQVPWLLEIKNLSEARAFKRQQSMETAPTPELTNDDNKKEDLLEKEEPENETKAKLVFEASKNEFVPDPPAVSAPSPKLQRASSVITTPKETVGAPLLQRQASVPAVSTTNSDPVRRLSSLLQHDIKAAANAKCIKLVKQTTPVPPKPKDPHTVFREQLQKATAARDKRVEETGTIDEQLKRNNSDADLMSKSEEPKVTTPRNETVYKRSNSSEPPETLPKPPRYHKNVTLTRNVSSNSKIRQTASLERGRNGPNNHWNSYEWTPEDDLDSDDNLSDREEMTYRKGSSDGFKSTIIPNSMVDMKGKGKKKGKEKKKKDSFSTEDQPRNKFGSVKKLKKSMHKGVRNAFGSISKASGKLLRKQRAEDLETVQDAPKNWSLQNGHMKSKQDRSYQYIVPNGYHDHDGEDASDNEHIDYQDHEFTEVVFKNAANEAEESSSEEEEENDDSGSEQSPQPVKRAGVAYISAKGKLVLVQDQEDSRIVKSDERKASKAKKKKETKQKSKVTVNDKENENLLEKQRQLEENRRKQLEMELEYHKRREAETRDRLQRLESAHLQQQINAQLLQQQQQQNISMVSAPQLPPAGTFPPNYTNLHDSAHTQSFTNLFTPPLPQNGFQSNFGLYQQSTPYNLQGSVPSIPYDLNDYMRMLGLQNPPTSQQMAFFMNNMTLTGQQPFDRKSNPTLFDVINQTDQLKQYSTSGVSYPTVDTRKQGFQAWASTPNIHGTSMSNNVPMADFVSSYNGAPSTNNTNDEKVKKPRNPLYNSDDSDEGLSPQRSVVHAQVRDFRPVPMGSESEKFMKQYGSSASFTHTKPNSSDRSFSDLSKNGRFPQRQGSVSPSNSSSTVDSAITSMSATVSPPSSPSKSTGAPESPIVLRSDRSSGYRTILDLSSNKTQISMSHGHHNTDQKI